MNKKIIIPLITALLLISLVLGADWTQHTPSPVTNNIYDIAIASTGKALAITNGGTNYVSYNGSKWTEITAPNSSLISGWTWKGLDKTNDGKIWVFYVNTTHVRTLLYNTATETFSLHNTGYVGYTSHFSEGDRYGTHGVACVYESGSTWENGCYLVRDSSFCGSGRSCIIQIVPTYSVIANVSQPLYSTPIGIGSNQYIYSGYMTSNQFYFEWNGVSFVLRGGGYYWGSLNQHLYRDSAHQLFCMSTGGGGYASGIKWFNISTGVFDGNTLSCFDVIDADGELFFLDNSNSIKTLNWGSGTATTDTTTTYSVYTIDYDANTDTAWAGGGGGIIYEYTPTNITPPAGEYTLTTNIIPNPTTYAQEVMFYATPTHPEGELSNITCNLTNTTGDHKQLWNILNVPSGVEVYNSFGKNELIWLDFEPENYTYTCYATSQISSDITSPINITWQVISSGTQNVTIYDITGYSLNISGITGIGALDKFSETQSYLIGENTTTTLIISFDITNPNNIQHQQKSTTASHPTSIAVYDNKLYLGTNNELYIYNDSGTGYADNLIFDKKKGWALERDYIQDVTDISDTYAWVCQDGTLFEDDDAYLYNYTSNNFEHKINENPCQSIFYDDNKDLLIIHRGKNNDIKIYNQSNHTLLSTIDFTNQISEQAINDLIDTYNNHLFIITASNTITKYDITNTSNPNKISECRTDTDIISLEALSNNEVIIGTPNHLKVCDFANNETYDVNLEVYIAKTIITYLEEEKPYEIQRMNNEGKFHVAEDNKYGVYFYEKRIEEQEINNPPTITSIIAIPDPACLNEEVEVTIFASDPDPEDQYLRYDWDCEGTKSTMINEYSLNDFTCTYTTTGTKNIVVFVRDTHGATVTSSTTVTINDCVPSLKLKFELRDKSTAEPIQGVLVAVTGVASDYTDIAGKIDVSVTEDKEYIVDFTKNGYYPLQGIFTPSTNRIIIQLEPKIEGDTVLTVITEDNEGTRISGSLVSISNPITGQNKYGITDTTGTITFTQMFTGNKLILSAMNEDKGYEIIQQYTSLTKGEQKTITITYGTKKIIGEFPVTNRHCADTISGVILCGNLSTTGIGSSCTQDTDCISGRCMVALTSGARKCSKFNYTLCDSQGINRGNICIFRNIIRGIISGAGSLILDYFLYALILTFLIIAGLIIKKQLTH